MKLFLPYVIVLNDGSLTFIFRKLCPVSLIGLIMSCRYGHCLLSILYTSSVILNECGLTTLETRRLRGDQIEVFKILNGYENIDSNIFFEIKESKITRGHNYTLVKKQSRLDVRKYSFSQRTINVWNNLSTDCVQASSVNMFKNKIDKYLVKAGYT